MKLKKFALFFIVVILSVLVWQLQPAATAEAWGWPRPTSTPRATPTPVPSLSVVIQTNIENIADYPSIANTQYSYEVRRTTAMTSGNNSTASYPSQVDPVTFTWKHGSSKTLTWTNNLNTGTNLFWFGSATNTPSQLSLASVTFNDSKVSYYKYTDNGRADIPATAYNWLNVNKTSGTVYVTLNFRYNPDIDAAAPVAPPEPDYSKTIDYLGDGVANPDTRAKGDNDYRLYLDVTTESASEIKRRDIVFLLDVSNSMLESMGSGKTRFNVMKETVSAAINSLTQDPNNFITIIKFGTRAELNVTQSSDRTTLINFINSMSAPNNGLEGGTNYYESFKKAADIISADKKSTQEKIVFFISDGQPTASQPAANALGYDYFSEIGALYAEYGVKTLPRLDGFYSVFIGSNNGNAATLQNITQMANADERYTVQVTNTSQLTNALDRFISKVSNNLYNVAITDHLSTYVNYAGDLKVVQESEGRTGRTLVNGQDYTVTTSGRKIEVKLLLNSVPATRYTVSYNVKASDAAFNYWADNYSYPNVGDIGTDYPGNSTSSGMPGFYSNTKAELSYNYGTNGTAVKTYDKPVIQLVEPDAIDIPITLNKVLEGKDLVAGQFEFEIFLVRNGVKLSMGTAKNNAAGRIIFDTVQLAQMGQFTYEVREVIPDEKEAGITYDSRVLQVAVNVSRVDEVLVADISYPDGTIFTNTYTAAPVDVEVEAAKVLIGRPLEDQEFEFSLKDNVGVTMRMTRNDADGTVRFGAMTFSQVGVYKYVIRESIPVPLLDPTIVYDTKSVQVDIIVTDAGGYLTAEVEYLQDSTFVNSYSYEPLLTTLDLHMVLTGMQLSTDQFSFELTGGPDGTIVATNNTEGTISFPVRFTAPGTFNFTIKQLIPDPARRYMTYDERELNIRVIVRDVDGELVAEVAAIEESTFYNRYQIRGGIW